MEEVEPLAQAGTEPARQALLAAEIDDMQFAARRQPVERARPARPASPASSTGCRTRRCARSPARRTAAPDRRRWRRRGRGGCRTDPSRSTTRRAVSSISERDVDAEEAHAGIGARGDDQVAGRAAADLQHPAAGRRVEPADQPVAAQQVVLAGDVVDMPLPTIDPIHQLVRRSDVRHRSSLEDVEVEAAIDRRAVARAELLRLRRLVAPAVEERRRRPGRAAATARRRCGRSRARRAARCG